MLHFADRLIQQSKEKESTLVVGLDPNITYFPETLLSSASTPKEISEAIYQFNKLVIDAVYPYVLAVKPQLAFYETYGSYGIQTLEKTISYATQKNLLVINDAKRNDIGSTASAYAEAFLGENPMAADAVTVNPFLGSDGLTPFIDKAAAYGKGVFVLNKTSNPSAGEIQDLRLTSGEKLYLKVSKLLQTFSKNTVGDSGYSYIGVVVGATYPEDAKCIRDLLPHALFLVPGFGTQGGAANQLSPYFDQNGFGSLISSSRAILYSYRHAFPNYWRSIDVDTLFETIQKKAQEANEEINQIRF